MAEGTRKRSSGAIQGGPGFTGQITVAEIDGAKIDLKFENLKYFLVFFL